MAMKTLIHQGPTFGPGHLFSKGGIHSRVWACTCQRAECGAAFESKMPMQKYCSIKCQRAVTAARAKRKAGK